MLLLCVVTTLMLTGCGGGSTTQFTLHTVLQPPVGTYSDDPLIYTDGFCGDCFNFYQGTCNIGSGLGVSIPLAQTDQHGFRTATNVCVPANWNLARYQSSSCPIPVLNFAVYLNTNQTAPLPCNAGALFTATPSSINLNSPPSTITFSGDPVASSTYGMPRVDFYNESGNGIGNVTATSMAGDGSSVTVAMPAFLRTQYSGDNSILGYSFDPATAALTPMPGSPFLDGQTPSAVTVSPKANILVVGRINPGHVASYRIDPQTGALTSISGNLPNSGIVTGPNPNMVLLLPK